MASDGQKTKRKVVEERRDVRKGLENCPARSGQPDNVYLQQSIEGNDLDVAIQDECWFTAEKSGDVSTPTGRMAIMTACIDSTASAWQKLIWPIMLFLICTLLVANLGCGRADSDPASSTAIHGIDSQLITRHGELQFVEDPEVGRRLSRELGKPSLLFFTADWCTYCRQMEETAFTDSSVGKLSENFVCVLVDADLQPEVCRDFSVDGYPTIQFVSADGRSLNRLVGRQSALDLASGMRAALKRFAWLNDPDTRIR